MISLCPTGTPGQGEAVWALHFEGGLSMILCTYEDPGEGLGGIQSVFLFVLLSYLCINLLGVTIQPKE